MDFTFFSTFFGWIGQLVSVLNSTQVFGVSLWIILLSFVVTSMVITVFWRGAQG